MVEDNFCDGFFDVNMNSENALLNEFYMQSKEDITDSFIKRQKANIEEIETIYEENNGRDF